MLHEIGKYQCISFYSQHWLKLMCFIPHNIFLLLLLYILALEQLSHLLFWSGMARKKPEAYAGHDVIVLDIVVSQHYYILFASLQKHRVSEYNSKCFRIAEAPFLSTLHGRVKQCKSSICLPVVMEALPKSPWICPTRSFRVAAKSPSGMYNGRGSANARL